MEKLIEVVENVIIWTGRILLGAFLLIVGLIGVVVFLFYAIEFSWIYREYHYYKDPTQFVEVTAEVGYVYWDTAGVCISMTEIPEGFSERYFDIEGESFDVVLENGLKEKLQEGQTVTFIAAPRYFGDGYTVPIVGISVDGVEYLSFDVGHPSLLNEYPILQRLD